MLRFLVFFGALLLGLCAWSAPQLPPLNRPVVDTVGVLNSSQLQTIENQIRSIRQHQGPQIGIFIAKNLEGYAVEDYSYQVASAWKLGSEKKDDGLLLFIAIEDRKMRIEVGSGLEGEVTDLESHQYIKKLLKPAFRQGQYAQGIQNFLLAIEDKFKISELPQDIKEQLYQADRGDQIQMDPPYHPGWGIGTLLVLMALYPLWRLFFKRNTFARGMYLGCSAGFFTFMAVTTSFVIIFTLAIIGFVIGLIGIGNFLLLLASGANSGRRGGGFGGGSSGWGGGGGGFSGGGASGDW